MTTNHQNIDSDGALKLPDPLPKILHLGCGRAKHREAFGIDTSSSSKADLLWDLDRRPWPLPDDAFDRIYAVNVLEHLDDVIGTMEEIHRVGRPGSEVRILVPFPSGHHTWTDPTHKRAFMSRSFQYFTSEFAALHFSYSQARFEVVETTYDRQGDWDADEGFMWAYRPKWIDRFFLRLANRHKDLYERRFLYWYPVRNVYFRLRVEKVD